MKNKIQGLVLRVEAYKEKDALIKVLTEEKIVTLYARGIYKNNAKNLRLAQPFTYNEFLIEDKGKMPLLLQGSTIKNYYHIQEDLEKSSICFVIHDCLHFSNSEVFEALLEVWNSANNNLTGFYLWSCFLLRFIIDYEGIMPYVDGCVSCHDLKVETFSIHDGGFLCHECNHGQYAKWDIEQMRKLRSLFKCKIENLDYLFAHFHFNLDDFVFFAKWLEYHTHKQLASLKFLTAIRNM